MSAAPARDDDVSTRRRAARLRTWTRQLHNYVGLYLLLFLWLFSVSGLVLNHSGWAVAHFWKARQETTAERAVRPPRAAGGAAGDLALSTELMRQLAIVGEIGEVRRDTAGRLAFQVVRPGRVYRVEWRPDDVRARVVTTRLNGWGVLDALHKFTGVSIDDRTRTRDWALTRLWALAMDALGLGMLTLVLSGLHLWYRLPEKRRPGLIALALGVACCAFFLYGLGARLG